MSNKTKMWLACWIALAFAGLWLGAWAVHISDGGWMEFPAYITAVVVIFVGLYSAHRLVSDWGQQMAAEQRLKGGEA